MDDRYNRVFGDDFLPELVGGDGVAVKHGKHNQLTHGSRYGSQANLTLDRARALRETGDLQNYRKRARVRRDTNSQGDMTNDAIGAYGSDGTATYKQKKYASALGDKSFYAYGHGDAIAQNTNKYREMVQKRLLKRGYDSSTVNGELGKVESEAKDWLSSLDTSNFSKDGASQFISDVRDKGQVGVYLDYRTRGTGHTPESYLESRLAGNPKKVVAPPKPKVPKVVAPKPEPKPEKPKRPDVLSPAGKPVSGGLDISDIPSASSKSGGGVRDGITAIESVHGDGDLPKIPVSTKGNPKGTLAAFFSSSVTDAPLKITVSNRGGSQGGIASSFTHEVGHFLDNTLGKMFGSDGKYLSENESGYSKMSGLMEKIKGSRNYQDISNFDFSVYIGGRRYKTYVLTNKELFARAYAQWVSYRSGDSAMINAINGYSATGLNRAWGSQWDIDDFAPIADAMEDMFYDLGWMK